MRQGPRPASISSRLHMSPRSIPLGPIGAVSLAVAALLLTPACRKSEAEGATLGLEQALRDTRASLAALGLPSAPGTSQTERPGPLPPPPTSASSPRRQGASPPATAVALKGQISEAVILALGEPALRRREGDAEIWLYQAPDCRLDLVFYGEASRLVLTHAAARAFGARRLTESACMDAVARAPNPPPWTAPGGGG